jgi:Glycosyl transferase family 2
LVLVRDGSAVGSPPVRDGGLVDPRVEVVTTKLRGLAAACNAGLDQVKSQWVLFLCHGAWLSPETLQKLLGAAAERPDVDCVFGGWGVVTVNGTIEHRHARYRAASGMEAMLTQPPFPLFCAMSKTSVLRSVGGFDTSLGECEDWDLWLRLARGGGRFLEMRDQLFWQRIFAVTPSAIEHRLSSGLTVIDRSFGVDGRVSAPLPQYREGVSPRLRREARTAWSAHMAGLAIGAGGAPTAMLATLAEEPDAVARSLETIAYELYDTVPAARG